MTLTLFKQIRQLSVADQRFVLGSLDAHLAGTSSPRALVALDALERFKRERGPDVSKRRYEAWRAEHPERASLPSATFIANTFSHSWSAAMDAVGGKPKADPLVRRLKHPGPLPSDENLLHALRDCAASLGVPAPSATDYEAWARERKQRCEADRPLATSRATFISRFGSFRRALMLAGLEPPAWKGGPRDRRKGYSEEVLVACLRAAAAEWRDGPLTTTGYARWKAGRLAAASDAGEFCVVPEIQTITRRWGSWPAGLVAAGLLTEEQAARWFRGQGQRFPDEVLRIAVERAAHDIAGPLTRDAFTRWRRKELREDPTERLPGAKVVFNRLGTATVRAVAESARSQATGAPRGTRTE